MNEVKNSDIKRKQKKWAKRSVPYMCKVAWIPQDRLVSARYDAYFDERNKNENTISIHLAKKKKYE